MAEEKKENKAPSPVLLVVLAVAVLVLVVDFLMKKQVPSPEPASQAERTRTERTVPVLPAGESEAKDREEQIGAGIIPPRDPFLPPAVVRTARAQQAPPGPAPAAPGRETAGTSPPPDSGRPPPAAEKSPVAPAEGEHRAAEPVWTGTIAAAGEQVVIIKYKNKSYILHLGEQLPETDYRVTEIRPEMVILRAPDKELRLRRKEEAQ